MSDYKDWNKAIYEFYFQNIDDDPMFSVDEETITYIGHKIGINENPVENFCRCILKEMDNGNKINPDGLSFYSGNNIPSQTAGLAFFIYIASLMGSDKDKYDEKAYWVKLEGDKDGDKKRKGKIEEFLGYKRKITQSDRSKIRELFESFAIHVSDKLGIEYTFENYFSYPNIGIPMTQAVITERDYCKLTQEFKIIETKTDKINIKNIINFIVNDIKRDSDRENNKKKYSLILRTCIKKIAENENLETKIKEKLEKLYEKWVDSGKPELEFDEKTKKRKVNSINLLYSYYTDVNDELHGFYTARIIDGYNSIRFNDEKGHKYELIKDDDPVYYKKIPLKNETLTLKEKSYRSEEGLIVKREAKDYIIFKRNVNIYIESRIKEGDTFAIISNETFFNEKKEYIEDNIIIDGEMPYRIPIEDTSLYVSQDMMANSFDNDMVSFDPKEKLHFKKGLKTRSNENTWIKEAPPIIENEVEITIINEINGDQKEFQKGLIDLRKEPFLKKEGSYKIELGRSNNEKNYRITTISDVEPNQIPTQPKIYHVLFNDRIERTAEKNADIPIIFGAFIDNISSDYDKCVGINNKKLTYIMEILKQHNNLKRYKIPDNIKEILDVVIKYCDDSNKEKLKDYLKRNDKIDNYICVYLNRIKEVIYE